MATAIPVLLGSLRPNGNNIGLSQLLVECCIAHGILAASASSLLPTGSSLPTGPVLDEVIAAAIQDPLQYSDPNVQAWSKLVSNSPAIIIITPQYNWGFPGPLKNSLDHLYTEWKDKPFLIITYGGHGGNKCGDALKIIIEGGLKGKLITEPVNIILPRQFIIGGQRVTSSDPDQKEFIEQFKQAVSAPLKIFKEEILQKVLPSLIQ